MCFKELYFKLTWVIVINFHLSVCSLFSSPKHEVWSELLWSHTVRHHLRWSSFKVVQIIQFHVELWLLQHRKRGKLPKLLFRFENYFAQMFLGGLSTKIVQTRTITEDDKYPLKQHIFYSAYFLQTTGYNSIKFYMKLLCQEMCIS